MKDDAIQFDFGQNWKEFSAEGLNSDRVEASRKAFRKLTEGVPLDGNSFLDIGFGQGLGLLLAAEAGARCVGLDINPKCEEALRTTARFFPGLPLPHAVQGSILDPDCVERLSKLADDSGYEVVHSWGVLHHTGDMRAAVRNAASLVASDGFFIVALYNRHWSSFTWKVIKFLYCKSPRIIQRFLISLFYPVIYAAKWLVTGRNPKEKERGMDFYYDVIDWVGGYPYEYASEGETRAMLEPLGFQLLSVNPPPTPTGCIEYVFRRRPEHA